MFQVDELKWLIKKRYCISDSFSDRALAFAGLSIFTTIGATSDAASNGKRFAAASLRFGERLLIALLSLERSFNFQSRIWHSHASCILCLATVRVSLAVFFLQIEIHL